MTDKDNDCQVQIVDEVIETYKEIKDGFKEGASTIIENLLGSVVYNLLKPIFDKIDQGIYAIDELMEEICSVADALIGSIDINKWMLYGLKSNAEDAIKIANREILIIDYIVINLEMMNNIGRIKENSYWRRIAARINGLLKNVDKMLQKAQKFYDTNNFEKANGQLILARKVVERISFYCNPKKAGSFKKLNKAVKIKIEKENSVVYNITATPKLNYKKQVKPYLNLPKIRSKVKDAHERQKEESYKKVLKQIKVMKYYANIILLYSGQDYRMYFLKAENLIIDVMEKRADEDNTSLKEVFEGIGKFKDLIPKFATNQKLKATGKLINDDINNIGGIISAWAKGDVVNFGLGISLLDDFNSLTLFGAQYKFDEKKTLINEMIDSLSNSKEYNSENKNYPGIANKLKSPDNFIDEGGVSVSLKKGILLNSPENGIANIESDIRKLLLDISSDIRGLRTVVNDNKTDKLLERINSNGKITTSYHPIIVAEMLITTLGVGSLIKLAYFDTKIFNNTKDSLLKRKKSLQEDLRKLNDLAMYSDSDIEALLSMLNDCGLENIAKNAQYCNNAIHQAGAYYAMFGRYYAMVKDVIDRCLKPAQQNMPSNPKLIKEFAKKSTKSIARIRMWLERQQKAIIDKIAENTGWYRDMIESYKETVIELKERDQKIQLIKERLKIYYGYMSTIAEYKDYNVFRKNRMK